jgi:uncharacterized protein (TIGR03435 family)
MKRWLPLPLLVSGMVVTLSAQFPKPTFEVASVKRNISGSGGWSAGMQKGGAYLATNAPLVTIVSAAYDLPVYRIVGGPDWIRGAGFDVNAKAAADVPREQLRLMLQSLLEDRFKLVVRKEQRDMPIYSLVVERSDGRLGPGLQRLNNCAEPRSKTLTAAVPDAANNARGCGPLSLVAGMASNQLAAPVTDNTGLTGTFAYSIYFSGDPLATNSDVPSFPTALREQFGLKLEPARGPVDVLVIDSVQPPTQD